MTFGFGVSDVTALLQLAWRTIQAARQACGEHNVLTQEVSSMHRVLHRLLRELSNPDSLINKAGADPEAREELDEHIRDCEEILNAMNAIVTKYTTFSDDKRSAKKTWQRVKFGNNEMQDLSKIRLQLAARTSALIMSLNLYSLGSQGRVEKELGEVGGDLKGIRAKVNWITANMAIKDGDGTVFTSYTNDDITFWQELRRELVNAGYDSSVLQRHKHLLTTYIEELGSRGAFDHQEISENDDVEGDTFLSKETASDVASPDLVLIENGPNGDAKPDTSSSSDDWSEKDSLKGSASDEDDFDHSKHGNIDPSTLETNSKLLTTTIPIGRRLLASGNINNPNLRPERYSPTDREQARKNASRRQLSKSCSTYYQYARKGQEQRRSGYEDHLPSKLTKKGSKTAVLLDILVGRRSTYSLKIDSVECLFCLLDDVPASKRVKLRCRQCICYACHERYIRLSTKDPLLMPPRCCGDDHHLSPRKSKQRFDAKFKEEWTKKYQESKAEIFLYCPILQCDGLVKPVVYPVLGNRPERESVSEGKCDRCSMYVCLHCKQLSHGRRACQTAMADLNTIIFTELARQEGWRQCYRCQTMIERQEGNNEMIW
jgi:hypothetical protein